MSKEITKAYILQQIQDKFKLRDLEPEIFRFSEMVVPIYNIEQHLMRAEIGEKERSIVGTGGREFYTVPDNEKWYLNGYNVIFMGAGAITVAGCYITRMGATTRFLYFDLTAGQTVSYSVNLPKQVILEPGDTININIDGYTSTQALRLYIDFIREDMR